MQTVRSFLSRTSTRRFSMQACALPMLGLAAFAAAAAPNLSAGATWQRAAQRDLGLSSVQIAQASRTQRDAPAQARDAQRRLGARYAGSWIERAPDDRFRLVVASSDPHASLKLDGAQLRAVRYSLSELEAAKARLDRSVRSRVAGISRSIDGVKSWHVDPASNSVLISVAPGAMERAIDLAALSGADAGMLRFQELPGVPQPVAQVYSGLQFSIDGSGSCSVGFSVRQGATKGFLTAGHCGSAGQGVRLGGAPAGYFAASEFPGVDRGWAVVDASHDVLPWVSNYAGAFFYVRGSNEAFHGSVVCRSGFTTGYQCGFITAKDVTVNSTRGLVTGLTQTNACAGFGDSGGGWIDVYEQAQGVTSLANIPAGANSNCGWIYATTWFYPVNPILQQYGLSLVTL